MPADRKCDEPSCRKRYTARRADSRFCSSACRQRAARAAKAAETKAAAKGKAKTTRTRTTAKVVELVTPPPDEPAVEPERKGGPVYLATLAELEDAGKVATATGQLALTMARRVDAWTPLDTGSSLASAAKAVEELLAKATRNTAAKDDPVDQLRKAREARRAAARGA